jgi:hypothetical protein
MAPVYAVPTEDLSRDLWSWASLDDEEQMTRCYLPDLFALMRFRSECCSKLLILVEHGRRELQLRITELKGEVMLNNYLEEHADEVSERSHPVVSSAPQI